MAGVVAVLAVLAPTPQEQLQLGTLMAWVALALFPQ
jgi:hypothetical protein